MLSSNYFYWWVRPLREKWALSGCEQSAIVRVSTYFHLILYVRLGRHPKLSRREVVYLAGNDPVLFISYQHDGKKNGQKKKNVSGAIFIFSFYFFFFFLRFLINTRSPETCPWRLFHLTSCLKVWRYINAPGSHNYVSSVFLVSFWPAAYFWWSVNESIYFTAFKYK